MLKHGLKVLRPGLILFVSVIYSGTLRYSYQGFGRFILQSFQIFKRNHEKEIDSLKVKHKAELAFQEEVFDRQVDEVIVQVEMAKNENEKLK